MPTSPSTHDQHDHVPPAVQARIDAGFACTRCGREDGPMQPTDDTNTTFQHSTPCRGAISRVADAISHARHGSGRVEVDLADLEETIASRPVV
ncbi:MAG: hypothetical protein KAH46_05475 [Mycobacterium sp.]|nr:hypothetical protein [Mycobacterium sp.]